MLVEFWSTYGRSILWIYSASSTLLVIIVSFLIFLEKRNPYKTIAWLAVINIFPILGVIVYLVFGQNIRKRKLIRTKYIHEIAHLNSIVDRQIECLKNNTDFNYEPFNSKK